MFQIRDVEKGLENQTGTGNEKSDSCENRTQSSGVLESNPHCHSTLKVLIVIVVLLTIFCVWYFLGTMFAVELLIVAIIAFFAAGGGYQWLRIFYKTIPRDFT